jgi:hypothetical protein
MPLANHTFGDHLLRVRNRILCGDFHLYPPGPTSRGWSFVIRLRRAAFHSALGTPMAKFAAATKRQSLSHGNVTK